MICGWAEFPDADGQLSDVALVWRVTADNIWGPGALPALGVNDATWRTTSMIMTPMGVALMVGGEWDRTTGAGRPGVDRHVATRRHA